MVLDALPLSGWELTGWGIVAFTVVLLLRYVASVLQKILTGELVTRRELDAMTASRDTFKDAWQVSQAAHQEKDAALAEVLPAVRTVVTIFEQLQRDAAARDERRPS
jgi:hypothetical protein